MGNICAENPSGTASEDLRLVSASRWLRAGAFDLWADIQSRAGIKLVRVGKALVIPKILPLLARDLMIVSPTHLATATRPPRQIELPNA